MNIDDDNNSSVPTFMYVVQDSTTSVATIKNVTEDNFDLLIKEQRLIK